MNCDVCGDPACHRYLVADGCMVAALCDRCRTRKTYDAVLIEIVGPQCNNCDMIAKCCMTRRKS